MLGPPQSESGLRCVRFTINLVKFSPALRLFARPAPRIPVLRCCRSSRPLPSPTSPRSPTSGLRRSSVSEGRAPRTLASSSQARRRFGTGPSRRGRSTCRSCVPHGRAASRGAECELFSQGLGGLPLTPPGRVVAPITSRSTRDDATCWAVREHQRSREATPPSALDRCGAAHYLGQLKFWWPVWCRWLRGAQVRAATDIPRRQFPPWRRRAGSMARCRALRWP